MDGIAAIPLKSAWASNVPPVILDGVCLAVLPDYTYGANEENSSILMGIVHNVTSVLCFFPEKIAGIAMPPYEQFQKGIRMCQGH